MRNLMQCYKKRLGEFLLFLCPKGSLDHTWDNHDGTKALKNPTIASACLSQFHT